MRAFVVVVAEGEVEVAADRLWQLGVRAVEERTGEHGGVELWTVVGDDETTIAAAAARLDAGWEWRTEECLDVWPEPWRDRAAPIVAGDRLVVVPAWWEGGSTSLGDRVRVVIEPGAAFGLGDHPTSRLCLGALDREMRSVPDPAVLDVGCGTGVLAIAAARLGAGRIRAIDVSAAAVESARANADRNGVAGRIEIDDASLAEVPGAFDLVLANILAPALISMAGDLRRLTAPRGRLFVSGVLADSHDHVLAALAPMGVCRTDTLDGWAAITLAHPEVTGPSRAAP